MKWLFSRQELFSRRDARQGSVSQKKQADMRSTKGTCKQNKSLNIYNYRLLTPTCFETLWFKEAMALFATRFFALCTFDPSPACYRHPQFVFFLCYQVPFGQRKDPTQRSRNSVLQRTCLGDRSAKVEADGTLVWKCFFCGPKTFVGTPLLDF